MRNYILVILLALVTCSCGEYQRAQKSTDFEYKFDYAKRAYEAKRYVQAATLLKDCVTVFKGSDKAEESLYLLGMSHYENKDYVTAGPYFRSYYQRYPKGKFTELARFYCGYGYYLDSPEPQDKLTLKQLQNAQLYYNLGNYLGNNYESAVIVAKNAIKDYPYSKYKEELEMLVLKARFQEADQSIDERKEDRFREVIDEYYSFINNYPESPNRQEADNIFKIASRYVND